mmetsp:Transcript_39250/g.91720  ORF Transcript_39250/g.91720 Transcript_39250/m.91720 type:complete len:129 (-) Transcript_39250:429-815(-)
MSLCSNEMEGSSVLLVDLVAIEFNPSSGPQQHKHIIHPALSGGSEESSIKTVESSSLLNRGCGTQRIEAAHLALPSPSQDPLQHTRHGIFTRLAPAQHGRPCGLTRSLFFPQLSCTIGSCLRRPLLLL